MHHFPQVFETGADIAFRGQVIAFPGLNLPQDPEGAVQGIQFHGMQADPVQIGLEVGQTHLRVLQSGRADDAVHFIPFIQKKFREVRAILPGYAGNQSLGHK
jgi:hypothetical protein